MNRVFIEDPILLMENAELIPHLFRTEYSKIVSVLCKTFGLDHIELAEDLVSDSFLKAAETWKLKGIPKNPTAWLYTVSKNNTKDYFKRQQIFKEKIAKNLIDEDDENGEFDIDLSEVNIKDSQLRMLFAICNPSISSTAQIALALRILCGFGIDEIATALLSNKTTINKRLLRAKQTLRQNRIDLSFPDAAELNDRLSNVLFVLYLLFNEGYYSTTGSEVISRDLCLEAMRLLYMLLENESTRLPESNALMALFCFHTSRFNARINSVGEQILYDDQDKGKWDRELIQKGEEYLHYSASGQKASKYHLEALIAYWHTRITINRKQKWQNILQLYNRLLQQEYSPVTALNRTYALAMVKGNDVALEEALKINLSNNHLYHSLLANLYASIDKQKQIAHLKEAIHLAKTTKDKKSLSERLDQLVNSIK